MYVCSEVPAYSFTRRREGSVSTYKQSLRLTVSESATFPLLDNFPSGNKTHTGLTWLKINRIYRGSPGSVGQVGQIGRALPKVITLNW